MLNFEHFHNVDTVLGRIIRTPSTPSIRVLCNNYPGPEPPSDWVADQANISTRRACARGWLGSNKSKTVAFFSLQLAEDDSVFGW